MLINRNYTRLWIGQTISAVGDVVFSSALLIWMGSSLFAGKPWAPMVTGTMMSAVALTVIVMGPVAGVLVDRWRKKRTMMRADLLCATSVAALAFVVLASGATPEFTARYVLLAAGVIVVASTAVAQFFHLALFVLVRDVVPPDRLGRATGYAQSSAAIAMIAGPPLAAVLVTSVGVVPALWLNAASFIASYLAVRGIAVSEHPTREQVNAASTGGQHTSNGFWHQFTDGLSWIRTSPPIVAVIAIAVLSALGTGALNSLDLYFVQENLGAGAGWFGTISACAGIGTILGALIGGRVGDRFGYPTPIWMTMALFGLLYMIYSRLTWPFAAAGISLLFGITLGVLNAVALPFIQQVVPRGYLARVGSTLNPLSSAANLLSIALSGTLVSTVLYGMDVNILGASFGAIDTVFLIGGALCLASGLFAIRALHGTPGQAAEFSPAETEMAVR